MKFFKSNKRGFTLIELLVVIAIISLLSSVVLAALNESRKKARFNAIVSEMKQVANQIELYRLNNSSLNTSSEPNSARDSRCPISIVESDAEDMFMKDTQLHAIIKSIANKAGVENNSEYLNGVDDEIPFAVCNVNNNNNEWVFAIDVEQLGIKGRYVGGSGGGTISAICIDSKNSLAFAEESVGATYSNLPTEFECFDNVLSP